jgi:hypothetical protein
VLRFFVTDVRYRVLVENLLLTQSLTTFIPARVGILKEGKGRPIPLQFQRKSGLAQPICSVIDSSNALIPFQAIWTPIQTRKNDDNCVITVIPVAPRICARRSANP